MPDYRLKRTRPPSWAPTTRVIPDAWNVMLLADGRQVERYVENVADGMVICEDGTWFDEGDVKQTWAYWSDLTFGDYDPEEAVRY